MGLYGVVFALNKQGNIPTNLFDPDEAVKIEAT